MSKEMHLIDKRQLAAALTGLEQKPWTGEFAWGQQLQGKDISSLSSFSIRSIQDSILIPVSHEDAETIKQSSLAAPQGIGFNANLHPLLRRCWQIDGKEILPSDNRCLFETIVPNLVQMALENLLGFKLEADQCSLVEAHLDKLLYLQPEGSFHSSYDLKKKPGMFATMLLTIPVCDGQRGGTINVEHAGQIKSFVCDHQSEDHFSLTTFLADCCHVVEPLTDGLMIIMVFDLVWTDAFTASTSPLHFPLFLMAMKEINESLLPWRTRQQTYLQNINNTEDKSLLETLHVNKLFPTENTKLYPKMSGDPTISNGKTLADASRSNTSPDSTVPDEESFNFQMEETLLLWFPLEGNYSATVSFHDLKGLDRLRAHILSFFNFIDVHLAVVQSNPSNYCDRENTLSCSTAIEVVLRPIYNSFLQCPRKSQLHPSTQLMGSFSPLLDSSDTKNTINSTSRTVLVIQPRFYSLYRNCFLQFDAVLNYLEFELKSAVKDENTRHQLISTLQQILHFCRREPFLVFQFSSKRTYRLMDLCVELRAKDEGLFLLELLAQDFCLDSNDDCINSIDLSETFFEGVRDQQVAKAIADFECRACGWKTCANVILRLVSAKRIALQFEALIHLAINLIERGCAEGARQLGIRFACIIEDMDDKTTQKLALENIDLYLDLVIALEECSHMNGISNLNQQTSSISTLFHHLDLKNQWQVLVRLQQDKRLKSISSCLELHRELCRRLKFGTISTASEKVSSEHNLAKSIDMLMEMANSSPCGRDSFFGLIENRIASLLECTYSQLLDDSVFSVLLSCCHAVIRFQGNLSLPDFELLLPSVGTVLSRLSARQYCRLILGLKNLNPDFKEPGKKLFLDICEVMTLKDQASISALPKDQIIQLMECFIQFEDDAVQLIRWLFQQLTLTEECGWDEPIKKLLLDVLLSDPDCWYYLLPASSSLNARNIVILIETWVTQLCDDLKDPEDFAGEIDGGGGLRTDIAIMIKTIISVEIMFPDSAGTATIATTFLPLVNSLSLRRIGHLIWDLYEWSIHESLTPKQLSVFMTDLYAQLCQKWVDYMMDQVLNTFSIDFVVEMLTCLLWLGKRSSLLPLADKICSSFPSGTDNPFVSKIVSTTEIRQLAAKGPHARNAFCLFLDNRIKTLRIIKASGTALKIKTRVNTELVEMTALNRSLQEQSHLDESSDSCFQPKGKDDSFKPKRLASNPIDGEVEAKKKC